MPSGTDQSNFSLFPGFAGGGRPPGDRFGGSFPNPFNDYASTQMPRNLYDVMRFCEYLWYRDGTYRMASQRVVRYFLTKIELEDVSDDEKTKWEDFHNKTANTMDTLASVGDNFMAYGNSYTSLFIPFRRHLRCPSCSFERPIDKVKFEWKGYEFHAGCPVCSHNGKHDHVDRRSIQQDRIRVIEWSPHQIRLLFNPISHDTIYYWDPPPDVKAEVRKGNIAYLRSTPWEIIETIKANKMFKFGEGVLFHVKEPTLAGLRNAGWGIPRILSNYRLMWNLQVLYRFNEAIGLDYIVPFRAITPATGNTRTEGDPLLHTNVGGFMSRVLGMISNNRKDPSRWHALPFPIEYNAYGGEGQNMAPTELITAQLDMLLNAQGYPAELYKGTLQMQAMPSALRMFERTWISFISAMNGWINWFHEQVSYLMNWEEVGGRLQPSTLAEDIEKKQVQLQLASAQQISRQTAYAPFGVDFRQEVKRMLEEEKFFQEEMAKFQKDQAKAQEMEATFEASQQMAQQQALAGGAGGAPMAPGAPAGPTPPGGMLPPAGGQPQGGTTPADMMAQADQIAAKLLGQHESIRRSELLNLKKSDETLHAAVKSRLESRRGEARLQGGVQVMQQQYGPGTMA